MPNRQHPDAAIGALVGATWATKMRSETLHKTLALLLVLIAIVLSVNHFRHLGSLQLDSVTRTVAGVIARYRIGVVASLMGVAGGELLIPTIALLYAIDIKLAGSLSLPVSIPTMVVAFARYSRDQSSSVLRFNARFVVVMSVRSILGTIVGGLLLGAIPSAVLIPLLALLLLFSAVKVWRHAWPLGPSSIRGFRRNPLRVLRSSRDTPLQIHASY